MSDGQHEYTPEELKAMSNDELARLGLSLDHVDVRYRKERHPIAGTKAEKRAERTVTFWFLLSIIGALGFIAVYLFWPHEYRMMHEGGYWWHSFYTPMLGITMFLAVFSIGVGAVHYTKKFIPEEIAVQERHDGPSTETDRATTVALLNDAWETSTLGRRKLLKRTMGGAAVLAGITAILPIGGMIKNPWRAHKLGIAGDGTMHTSGWTLASTTYSGHKAEKVYLGRETGAIGEKGADGHFTTAGVSRLVRIRPGDLAAGGMETVFPLPAEYVNDGDDYNADRDVYEGHMHSIHGARNAVMLIRLRTQDAAKVVQRKGQEQFHYGDYYAYSKICTHLGCPTSLYEPRTNRILCPCHQSQFDALHYGKAVFGPAARALPQLPIAVDEDGYLVANGDFIEAVGPAFWERRS